MSLHRDIQAYKLHVGTLNKYIHLTIPLYKYICKNIHALIHIQVHLLELLIRVVQMIMARLQVETIQKTFENCRNLNRKPCQKKGLGIYRDTPYLTAAWVTSKSKVV